jgi:hypothetical protein
MINAQCSIIYKCINNQCINALNHLFIEDLLKIDNRKLNIAADRKEVACG